jgi:hypothetical protein
VGADPDASDLQGLGSQEAKIAEPVGERWSDIRSHLRAPLEVGEESPDQIRLFGAGDLYRKSRASQHGQREERRQTEPPPPPDSGGGKQGHGASDPLPQGLWSELPGGLGEAPSLPPEVDLTPALLAFEDVSLEPSAGTS